MKYKILFPSEMDNVKAVDPSFDDEFEACTMLGIDTCLYDYDLLVNDGKFKSNLTDCNCFIIYRGWMLKPAQYKMLHDNVKRVAVNATMLNNPEEYSNCHCFPICSKFLDLLGMNLRHQGIHQRQNQHM